VGTESLDPINFPPLVIDEGGFSSQDKASVKLALVAIYPAVSSLSAACS
jgi:hypothetical protein